MNNTSMDRLFEAIEGLMNPTPIGVVISADGIYDMETGEAIVVSAAGIPDPTTGEVIPWADERYMFCGQVAYRAVQGRDPAVYCDGGETPPARCNCACPDRRCAFRDPAFDWERAARTHANQDHHNWSDYESADAYAALVERRRAERGRQ